MTSRFSTTSPLILSSHGPLFSTYFMHCNDRFTKFVVVNGRLSIIVHSSQPCLSTLKENHPVYPPNMDGNVPPCPHISLVA